MTIYIVKTFRGYFVTASSEEAELKANELFNELKCECKENRVKGENVWCRIDEYHAHYYFGAPFEFQGSKWINAV